ncbi:MAG: hypothetical protein JKY60_20200 [Kordiimonadaceae bacterium]|nr:hypothetical protein [Kordiimonadaceae bacterium]
MVKITNEQLEADVAQLLALVDGVVVTHGTAIINLQSTQITQHDDITSLGAVQGEAILNLQTVQVLQDDRLTTLEGAP